MGSMLGGRMDTSLDGVIVGVTAERRADQQARYLESLGAEVICAPVLQTIDARTNPRLIAATYDLIDHPADVLVVQTGQGFQWWLDAADNDDKLDGLLGSLRTTDVWCRGARASSAARAVGLAPTWEAATETVGDVAEHLTQVELRGHRVAIQLDGNDDQCLVDVARAQGAHVVELDVYRYAMPVDLEPCHDLIDRIITGHVDAVTFTTSAAIRHLRGIAASAGRLRLLDRAFDGACVAVVVGPVCASAASDVGWTGVVRPPTPRIDAMLDALTAALCWDDDESGALPST
ncbi:MAG: uroporphyrinogen-III synthase [Acidimicrobiales bacterium]